MLTELSSISWSGREQTKQEEATIRINENYLFPVDQIKKQGGAN